MIQSTIFLWQMILITNYGDYYFAAQNDEWKWRKMENETNTFNQHHKVQNDANAHILRAGATIIISSLNCISFCDVYRIAADGIFLWRWFSTIKNLWWSSIFTERDAHTNIDYLLDMLGSRMGETAITTATVRLSRWNDCDVLRIFTTKTDSLRMWFCCSQTIKILYCQLAACLIE